MNFLLSMVLFYNLFIQILSKPYIIPYSLKINNLKVQPLNDSTFFCGLCNEEHTSFTNENIIHQNQSFYEKVDLYFAGNSIPFPVTETESERQYTEIKAHENQNKIKLKFQEIKNN